MHWCRVRHVLCETERFENTLAARKEGCSVIAEDDNIKRDLVERKKALQKPGSLASIDAGLVLIGSNINNAFRIVGL